MSTSVYRSEQVVHYGQDGTHDATYWGFQVSTTSDGGEAFPFKDDAQRVSWCELFVPFFPGDSFEAFTAAGLYALGEFGSDGDRESWGYFADTRYHALDSEAVETAVEAWKEANL